MVYKNIIKNVLDRHKDGQGNIGSDSFRDMLSVEISSNLELEDEKKQTLLQKRRYEFIQNEMSQGEKEHQDAWSRGKAKDNPLNITMWKGWDGKEEPLSQEYLDQWTCDHCGKHTHEVEYDYLGNNRNHLQCELKLEMGETSEQLELELN